MIDQAEGSRRRKVVTWIRQEDVGMPGIISSMSINPSMMKAVQEINQAISFGASALTRVQEESIAVAVSVINRCRF